MRRRGSAALVCTAIALVLGPVAGFLLTPASVTHVGWGVPPLVGKENLGWDPRPPPQVAVDNNGNAFTVWRLLDGGRWNLRAARFVPGVGWGPPTFVETSQDDALSAWITVDATGNAIATWNERKVNSPSGEVMGSSIWANRYEVGVDGGWGAPTRIDSGAGNDSFISTWSNPPLDLSSSGKGVVAWDEGGRIWASSFSPDSGWGAPVPGPEGGVEDVAVDETGTALVASCQRSEPWGCSGRMASRFVPGDGWEDATLLADTFSEVDTRIALTPSGGAVVVYPDWGDLQSGTSGIWVRRFIPGSGWEAATRLITVLLSQGLSVNDPSVATDRSGSSIVTWFQSDGTGWVSRFVPGIGWSTPRIVAAHTSWSPRIAMDPHGNAFLSWIEEGTRMRVMISRFEPALGWGDATAIAEFPLTEGKDSPATFRVDVSTDPNGDAVAVWTEPDGIWANRFTETTVRNIQSGLDATNAKVEVLLAVQVALVTSTVLLLALYLDLRRRGSGTGRGPTERTGPAQPPPTRGSTRNGGRMLEAPANPIDRTRTRPSVRWSEAGGLLRLTAKERILLHLLDFAKYADAAEVPLALTQGGVADQAAVDLRHFAQYVRPLIREGLVRQRSARVKGEAQRRKVYVLADGGRQAALGVRDRIRSAIVRVRENGGIREATVAEVVAATRGSLSILDVVRASIWPGVVNLGDGDNGGSR